MTVFVEVRRHALRVGRAESLSPFGVRVATALGDAALHFDIVVSSRQVRAQETARLIGGRLDDTDAAFDPADGALSAGALARFESFHTAADLAIGRQALEAIETFRPNMGRMLVVTHAGIVQAIAAAITDGAAVGPPPGHCEGILLGWRDTWTVHDRLVVDEDELLGAD
jgi:broad specificity phosphatase PhoE